jgi:hypothetical protein
VVRTVESKVATLITAESIIVGLLVAFAVGIGPTLVSSIEKPGPEPIFGVVLAGFLISALALTAFRSILLLYQSIDISNLGDMRRSDERYRVGYDLFLMVIAGSGFYLLINAFSVLQYALAHKNWSPPGWDGAANQALIITAVGAIFFFCAEVFVLLPFEVTRRVRRFRDRVGTRLFPAAVGLAVGDTILFYIIIWLQGIPTPMFWLSVLFWLIWLPMLLLNSD